MRLVDYLDLGASVGSGDPCLTSGSESLSYAEVQGLSHWVAGALAALGVAAGDRVATLSGDDPLACAAVFGISRAGAVWCPVNAEHDATLSCEVLAALDCRVLLFTSAFAERVDEIRPHLGETTAVCIDRSHPWAMAWGEFLYAGMSHPVDRAHPDDIAMVLLPATASQPEVTVTGSRLATLTTEGLTQHAWLSDRPQPTYLAPTPATVTGGGAAGALALPVLARGGQIVVMTDSGDAVPA